MPRPPKRELSPKELAFVKYYTSGETAAVSAVKAGYSAHSAKNSAQQIMKKRPLVKAKIAEIREKVLKKAEFGLEQAMAEAQVALEFAYLRKNPMAAVKATELRSKLAGLLVERHDVNLNVVNIELALQAASNRVLPLLLQAQPNPNEIVVEEAGPPPPEPEPEKPEEEPNEA